MNILLEHIQIVNFKNHASEGIRCHSGINCLTGKNGMGKTNFLDAIYYLCMTKSFFSIPDANLVLHGQDFFRMEGQFKVEADQQNIVVKYPIKKKKVFENNKVPYERLAQHIGLLPIVMIAPDDANIALDGSEARRKFIDNTLSQIDQDYLQQLILYNKLLKQRNALLKKMAEEKRFQAALLQVYDQQMLAPAQFIFEKRKNFAEVLQPVFQVMHEYICNQQEKVQLKYHSPLFENNLEKILKQNQEKDRILQRTTSGIHRDDLVFQIEERPLKKFASQGQLKSYILSLKLSQFEILRQYKGKTPILLLDDIFDKLDQHRVRQLLSLLNGGNFGQIFITDTNPDRVGHLLNDLGADFQQLLVNNGNISEIPLIS